jgi:hypothetical protein
MQSSNNKDLPEAYTACWALWPNLSIDAPPIEHAIDEALKSKYLFYPEPEWPKYGYRPPENYPLLGAWRNQLGTVFAFLLDRDFRDLESRTRRVLLYVAGEKEAVEELGVLVDTLKFMLSKSEKRALVKIREGRRIEDAHKFRSLDRLARLFSFFTVPINVFSWYLRRLPPPDLPSTTLVFIYQLLVGAIHYAALFLLLILTLICIIYALRYGISVVRRF